MSSDLSDNDQAQTATPSPQTSADEGVYDIFRSGGENEQSRQAVSKHAQQISERLKGLLRDTALRDAQGPVMERKVENHVALINAVPEPLAVQKQAESLSPDAGTDSDQSPKDSRILVQTLSLNMKERIANMQSSQKEAMQKLEALANYNEEIDKSDKPAPDDKS